jgi:hypothetical protein
VGAAGFDLHRGLPREGGALAEHGDAAVEPLVARHEELPVALHRRRYARPAPRQIRACPATAPGSLARFAVAGIMQRSVAVMQRSAERCRPRLQEMHMQYASILVAY